MTIRKLYITLVVTSIVLVVASIGLGIYNAVQIYKLPGLCTTEPCDPAIDKELEARKRFNTFTRVGMFLGFALLAGGVIAYRRLEGKAHKVRTKSKIVY